MGGTGRPASSRSLRTFTRLIRLFTSFFTLSRPHSPSSSASSSSRVGSGSAGGWASSCLAGAVSCFGAEAAGAPGRGAENWSARMAGRSVRRPSLSHSSSSTSLHTLTNPASLSLTTPSTAAKRSSSRVRSSANRRARAVPRRRSYWRRSWKKAGGWNRSKLATPEATSQYSAEGTGLPGVQMAL